tara:strand:+ start:20386 stop:24516 length:4131 start_codon:yes stop_codon:yes gene_type:complete
MSGGNKSKDATVNRRQAPFPDGFLGQAPLPRGVDLGAGAEPLSDTDYGDPGYTQSYSSSFDVTMGTTSYSAASETITVDTATTARAGSLLAEKSLSPAIPEIIGVFDFFPPVDSDGEDTDIMAFLLMQMQLDVTIKIMLTSALQDTSLNTGRDELVSTFVSTASETVENLKSLINLYRVYALMRQCVHLKSVGAYIYTLTSNVPDTWAVPQDQVAKYWDIDQVDHDNSVDQYATSLGKFFTDALWYSEEQYIAATNTKLFKQLAGDLHRFISVSSFELFPDEGFIESRRESEADAWTPLGNTETLIDALIGSINGLEQAVSMSSWGDDYTAYDESSGVLLSAKASANPMGWMAPAALENNISWLIDNLPSEWSVLIRTLTHLISRDFSISNNAENQFQDLISHLKNIDSSITSGGTITLADALDRALGKIETPRPATDPDSENKASLSSVVSAEHDMSADITVPADTQILFLETYPTPSDSTYVLGSDYFLDGIIDNHSIASFTEFADVIYNGKMNNVILFLNNYLDLGDDMTYSSSAISDYPLGSNRCATQINTGQFPALCGAIAKNIHNVTKCTNLVEYIKYDDDSFSTKRGGLQCSKNEWITWALFSEAGNNKTLLVALCKFMAELTAYSMSGDFDAVSPVAGTMWTNSLADLVGIFTQQFSPSAGITGYMPGGIYRTISASSEASAGNMYIDETNVYNVLYRSATYNGGLLKMISRLDWDYSYDNYGDSSTTTFGNTCSSWTAADDDSQATGWGAHQHTEFAKNAYRSAHRGWSASTRAVLNTIIAAKLFNRYLAVTNTLSEDDLSTWKRSWNYTMGGITMREYLLEGMGTEKTSTKFQTVISTSNLANFWCAMKNIDKQCNFDGENNENIVNGTRYTTSKKPGGGEDISLHTYHLNDQGYELSNTFYKITQEIEGYILAPLVQEMNFIRDATRFLDGFSRGIYDTWSSIKTFDIEDILDGLDTETSEYAVRGLFSEALVSSAVAYEDIFRNSTAFLEDDSDMSAIFFPTLYSVRENELTAMVSMFGQSEFKDSTGTPDSYLNPRKRIVTVGLPIGLMTHLRNLQSACSLDNAVYDTDTTIKITLHLMNLQDIHDSVYEAEYLFDTSAYFDRGTTTADDWLEKGISANIVETENGELYVANLTDLMPRDDVSRIDWDSYIEESASVTVAKFLHDEDEFGFDSYDYESFTSTSSQVLQGDSSETELTSDELDEIFQNTQKSHLLKTYLRTICGIDVSETAINFNQPESSLNDLELGGTLPPTLSAIDSVELDSADVTDHFQQFSTNINAKFYADGMNSEIVRRMQREALRSNMFASQRNAKKILNPNVFERTFCMLVDLEEIWKEEFYHTSHAGAGSPSLFSTIYATIELVVD